MNDWYHIVLLIDTLNLDLGSNLHFQSCSGKKESLRFRLITTLTGSIASWILRSARRKWKLCRWWVESFLVKLPETTIIFEDPFVQGQVSGKVCYIYMHILYYTAIQYSLYHSILSVTPSLFQYLPMLVPGKRTFVASGAPANVSTLSQCRGWKLCWDGISPFFFYLLMIQVFLAWLVYLPVYLLEFMVIICIELCKNKHHTAVLSLESSKQNPHK